MDSPPEEMKNNSGDEVASGTGEGAASITPALAKPSVQSWGDKDKARFFSLTRNVLVNYVVNFAVSALGAYVFFETPFNKNHIEPAIRKIADKGSKIGIDPVFGKLVGDFFTRTQLLLCGGHALLPFMKWSHDHKKGLEFQMGHELDLLQESLGKGNAASKQNIEEYHRVSSLLSQGRHNRRERDPIPIHLNESDKALLAKYDINENLQFNEKRRSWGHVLKARTFGVLTTTTMSIVFSAASYLGNKHNVKWIDVKEELLKKRGGQFGEKFLTGLKHVGIKNSRLIGELLLLELLYTLGSKLGFDHIEKRQLKSEDKAERAKAEARLAQDEARERQDAIHIRHDKNVLSDLDGNRGATSSAIGAGGFSIIPGAGRTKITAQGGQDFRSRSMAKPDAAEIALT